MWIKIKQSKIWLYIFAGLMSVLLLTFSLHVFPFLTLKWLIVDASIFTAWLFLLIILLINVVNYGNFQMVPLPVRMMIYLLLALLTMFLLLGGSYWVDSRLFNPINEGQLLDILYWKGTYSLLVFMIAFQQFYNRKSVIDNGSNIEQITGDSLPKVVKTDEKQIKSEISDRISVKSGAKIHVVPLTEIICLLAEGDYVQLVTEKGKFLKEQTMKYFEQNLPENQFVRIHRSCIVNVTAISRIDLYDRQNFHLALKNGDSVKVSLAGYKLLKDKLKL
jgi:DNA-binding LytR/AlgR family response regulator